MDLPSEKVSVMKLLKIMKVKQSNVYNIFVRIKYEVIKMKKILDVRVSKEEQNNSKELKEELAKRKWQVQFRDADGKIRFAYADEPKPVEDYLRDRGATILEVVKLT